MSGFQMFVAKVDDELLQLLKNRRIRLTGSRADHSENKDMGDRVDYACLVRALGAAVKAVVHDGQKPEAAFKLYEELKAS
jgi:ribosomal 50S subunit-recycling heat shock protein